MNEKWRCVIIGVEEREVEKERIKGNGGKKKKIAKSNLSKLMLET